jgi:hypothetical protein
LDEWKVARDAMKEFDGRRHDLRKVGFGFLTALLATESFLIPGSLADGDALVVLPDIVKFCVLLVTLTFIMAIALIERNYQLFIKAINQRALVLERLLNIELSEVITLRYRVGRGRLFCDAVYLLFVSVIVLLGYATLMPDDPTLFVALCAVSAFAVVVIIWIMEWSDLAYHHGEVDWSLDRIQCGQGDSVAITLTNLSKSHRRRDDREVGTKLLLPEGILFEVKPLDGRTPPHQHRLEAQVIISPEDAYTCAWKVDKPPGMYMVYPGHLFELRTHRIRIGRKDEVPRIILSWKGETFKKERNWSDKALKRRITVMPKKEPPTICWSLVTIQTDAKS